MLLNCSVLGKDMEITENSMPVISPYWRLQRNGNWPLLSRYQHEQKGYSLLSPIMGATLALMDGRLTFRHLSLLVQYAFGFKDLERSKDFVTRIIAAVNKDYDAVVNMTPELEPYIQRLNPFEFSVRVSHWKNQTRPAIPVSLNLMFSNECQTNCVCCHAHRRPVPESCLLPTERWREILQEAKGLGIDQVTLSGGDPLFRKDALLLIEQMIDLEMLFVLSTKCYITEEIADRLVASGMTQPVNQYVREIQLSMDGPDETTADQLAGTPGYYSRAVHSIRNLLKRGFNLRVKAVVTPLNAPRINEWIEQLADMGVAQISLAAYNGSFHSRNEGLFLSQADKESIAEQCEQARLAFPDVELTLAGLESSELHNASASSLPTSHLIDVIAEEDKEIREQASHWQEVAKKSILQSTMTIAPDGKVVLSDVAPQDERFFVGDMRHQTIMEVWNGESLLMPTSTSESLKGYEIGYCVRDIPFSYDTIQGGASAEIKS